MYHLYIGQVTILHPGLKASWASNASLRKREWLVIHPDACLLGLQNRFLPLRYVIFLYGLNSVLRGEEQVALRVELDVRRIFVWKGKSLTRVKLEAFVSDFTSKHRIKEKYFMWVFVNIKLHQSTEETKISLNLNANRNLGSLRNGQVRWLCNEVTVGE